MKPLQTPGESITVHSVSDFRQVVVIPNATAQDASLSWAARGLLTFMLSMPSNWHFHEHDLVNRSPMGRDHLRSIVRELEAHGYLKRHQRRDANGRQCGSHWEVWARPVETVQTVNAPQTGNPSTENPSTGTPQSLQAISPQTENPSTAEPRTGKPLTEKPSTENPSTYKRHKEQKPQKTKTTSPLPPKGEAPQAAQGTGKRKRELMPRDITPADVPFDLADCAEQICSWWGNAPKARTKACFEQNCDLLRRYSPEQRQEILGASIRSGWQGLFPPRETRATQSGSHRTLPTRPTQGDYLERALARLDAGITPFPSSTLLNAEVLP